MPIPERILINWNVLDAYETFLENGIEIIECWTDLDGQVALALISKSTN